MTTIPGLPAAQAQYDAALPLTTREEREADRHAEAVRTGDMVVRELHHAINEEVAEFTHGAVIDAGHNLQHVVVIDVPFVVDAGFDEAFDDLCK